MNMPTSPVQTLPLSKTITASERVSTASRMTVARASSVWSSRQTVMSKKDNGLNPSTSSPAIAMAANTASTEVRPSSDQ